LKVRTYSVFCHGRGKKRDPRSDKGHGQRAGPLPFGARTENIAHDSFWSTFWAADGVVCGDDSLASTLSRSYSRSLEATPQLLSFRRCVVQIELSISHLGYPSGGARFPIRFSAHNIPKVRSRLSSGVRSLADFSSRKRQPRLFLKCYPCYSSRPH
jgi:hypothetical protein